MEVTAAVREHQSPEGDVPARAGIALAPALRPGTELLGPYQDGAYEQQRYLVRRPDGQIILVSEPLYAIIRRLDGHALVPEIATAVSTDLGKTVEPSMLETLIAARLMPLGLVGDDDGGAVGKEHKNRLLSLSMRVTVLPSAVTQAVGRALAPLFAPVLVAYAIVVAVGIDVWFFTSQPVTHPLVAVASSPRLLAAVIGLYLLGALFHECGHAAAAVRGGGRPGRIGVGVYVVIPAFFTDVSDTYRLDRAGRLRTDLGGVYFNILGMVALGIAYATTSSPVLALAFILIQIAMLEQLLPIVRMDGYFVLGDIVGVPDLFSRVLPNLRVLRRRGRAPETDGLRRGARAIVTIWTVVVIPCLGAMLALMVVRLPLLARTSFQSARAEWSAGLAAVHHGDVLTVVVVLFSLITLGVPFLGMAVIVGRMSISTVSRFVRRGV